MISYWGLGWLRTRTRGSEERLGGHWSQFHWLLVCAQLLSHIWLLTVCFSVDQSPPGSSVHGMLQARILEQVAISYSRGSSQLWDWNHISCIDRLYVFNTYLWIIYYVSGTVLPGEQEIRFCFQRKTQHLLPVIMCKQLKFLLKREMVKQWHKQW